jgi:hypothetical protein
MNKYFEITWLELSETLGVDYSKVQTIHPRQLNYRNLSKQEIAGELELQANKTKSGLNQKSGEHRRDIWEKGWKEIYDGISNNGINQENLTPKYYRGEKIFRYQKQLVEGQEGNEDRDLQIRVVDLLVADLLSRVKIESIHEFGCGTGINLIRWSTLFGDSTSYFGYDWASSSQDILSLLREKKGLKINGINYNFFDPKPLSHVQKTSLVITVTALEQIGANYLPFLTKLLESPATRFVHFEPFFEDFNYLDPCDRASIEYCKSRNYLHGFLEHLRQLEKEKIIKIICYKRTGCGSRLHEGATYLEWKKL